MHFFKILLLTILLSTYCTTALAYTLQGTVAYVYDGDTIKLREGFTYHRIRLASIDAPEKDQPYGLEATQILRRLMQNKTVLANVIDTDKYGRKIAYIHITDHGDSPPGNKMDKASIITNPSITASAYANPNLLTVNCYLLTVGAAWHYKAFDKTSAQYDLHYALEQEAKANKRGLWAQDYPIAPWIWRRNMPL